MAGRNTKLQENILYSYFEEMGNRTLRVALINWSGDGTDSTGLYIQPVFTGKDDHPDGTEQGAVEDPEGPEGQREVLGGC
jgi:hypothetical protein